MSQPPAAAAGTRQSIVVARPGGAEIWIIRAKPARSSPWEAMPEDPARRPVIGRVGFSRDFGERLTQQKGAVP
jgi:hypothetical protein